MDLYSADWVHHTGTFQADHGLLVDAAGRIRAVGPRATLRADGAGAVELGRDPRESAVARALLHPTPRNRPTAAKAAERRALRGCDTEDESLFEEDETTLEEVLETREEAVN
mgnify:CR=1 FL=1